MEEERKRGRNEEGKKGKADGPIKIGRIRVDAKLPIKVFFNRLRKVLVMIDTCDVNVHTVYIPL